MSDNIFFKAAEVKLRFESPIGHLSVEQLFDLHLTSKNRVSLDSLSRTVLQDKAAEGNTATLVQEPATKRAKTHTDLRIAILTAVIKHKQDKLESLRQQSAKAEVRQLLETQLEERKKDALKSLSTEELEERLKNL